MAEPSDDLERLSREQLILRARVLGVERAELMTRVELRDEIVRRSEPDPVQQKRARGLLGVARDLVASVVEAGLNLPDAAALIRGDGSREDWRGPPPVATVTLAEIYATQGHVARALQMLDEVLVKEPDHDPARALRDRLAAADSAGTSPRKRIKINLAESAPESSELAAAEQGLAADTVESESTVESAAAPTEAHRGAEASPEQESAPSIEESAPSIEESAPSIEESAPSAATHAEPMLDFGAVASRQVELAAPDRMAASTEEIVAARVESKLSAPAQPCLLTLAFAGRRQVYWEMPTTAWQSLRARAPEGRAVLRVVYFKARGGRVERTQFDISPQAEIGISTLPGLNADSVVRAALGWEENGRFTAFVLATDLGWDIRPNARAARFRPHQRVGSSFAAAEQRALAHVRQLA